MNAGHSISTDEAFYNVRHTHRDDPWGDLSRYALIVRSFVLLRKTPPPD